MEEPSGARTTEPCFSWLNPGQIVIHRAAFGPLQPAVVGILSNDGIAIGILVWFILLFSCLDFKSLSDNDKKC